LAIGDEGAASPPILWPWMKSALRMRLAAAAGAWPNCYSRPNDRLGPIHAEHGTVS